MSLSVGTLQTAFKPEFDNVDTGLISSCIADAVARVSLDSWGSKYDLAVRYLAAHLLSIRAAGQNARLVSDLNSTIYGKEYLSMVRGACGGPQVAGGSFGTGSYWGVDMRPFGWIA